MNAKEGRKEKEGRLGSFPPDCCCQSARSLVSCHVLRGWGTCRLFERLLTLSALTAVALSRFSAAVLVLLL